MARTAVTWPKPLWPSTSAMAGVSTSTSNGTPGTMPPFSSMAQ
jgi:hypothetical protein